MVIKRIKKPCASKKCAKKEFICPVQKVRNELKINAFELITPPTVVSCVLGQSLGCRLTNIKSRPSLNVSGIDRLRSVRL